MDTQQVDTHTYLHGPQYVIFYESHWLKMVEYMHAANTTPCKSLGVLAVSTLAHWHVR